jgi:hypothetical protein
LGTAMLMIANGLCAERLAGWSVVMVIAPFLLGV